MVPRWEEPVLHPGTWTLVLSYIYTRIPRALRARVILWKNCGLSFLSLVELFKTLNANIFHCGASARNSLSWCLQARGFMLIHRDAPQIRLLPACEKSEGEEAKVRGKKQQSYCARANGSRTKVVQDQPSTPCRAAALRTQVGMNALCQEQNIASDANLCFFFWRPAYLTQVLWARDSEKRRRNAHHSPVQCLV